MTISIPNYTNNNELHYNSDFENIPYNEKCHELINNFQQINLNEKQETGAVTIENFQDTTPPKYQR